MGRGRPGAPPPARVPAGGKCLSAHDGPSACTRSTRRCADPSRDLSATTRFASHSTHQVMSPRKEALATQPSSDCMLGAGALPTVGDGGCDGLALFHRHPMVGPLVKQWCAGRSQ
eukprot:scaffold93050_cov63-Phaeocystis_antarctica.AAC.2